MMPFAILIDREASPPWAGKLFPRAFSKVEIPCAQNLITNPNMTEVGVVSFKVTFSGLVHPRPCFHARISLGWKPVVKFQLEVLKGFIA